MCVIRGLTHPNVRPVQSQLLSFMGEVSAHRRPDDEGARIDGRAGTATRLLAIIDLALKRFLATGKCKIGFAYLSFMSGTVVVRGNPLVAVAEWLICRGHEPRLCDSQIQLAKLPGAINSFIEPGVPQTGQRHRPELAKLRAQAEVQVLSSISSAVIDALMRLVQPAAVQGHSW